MINKKELLDALNNRKEMLTSQLKMSEGTLVSHNYILTCGAYTIESEEREGGGFIAGLTLKTFPSQWTKEGAEDIIGRHDFKTKDGSRAVVEAVPYKEWYTQQVESLKKTIEALTA